MGQTSSQLFCRSNRGQDPHNHTQDLDGYDIESQAPTKRPTNTNQDEIDITQQQQQQLSCNCAQHLDPNETPESIHRSYEELCAANHIGTDIEAPSLKPVIHIWQVGPLLCNCILIVDPLTRDAILIDPGGASFKQPKGRRNKVETIDLIPLIRSMDVNIIKFIITHAHFDHFIGIGEFREAFPTAKVWIHIKEKVPWQFLPLQLRMMRLSLPRSAYDLIGKPDEYFTNTDDTKTESINFLDGEVIYTPGHSEGSICIHFPSARLLISGDTLFRNAVGRSDLNGGSQRDLQRSILLKLYTLPPSTNVIPGHGPKTMIGHEKANNPSIRFGDPIPT